MNRSPLRGMPCSFQAVATANEDAGGQCRRGLAGWVIGAIARTVQRGVRRHRRRVAIAELQSLSDRQLADVGIERHRIAEIVDATLAREAGRDRDGGGCRF